LPRAGNEQQKMTNQVFCIRRPVPVNLASDSKQYVQSILSAIHSCMQEAFHTACPTKAAYLNNISLLEFRRQILPVQPNTIFKSKDNVAP
jgi:hypothetical protein